MSKLPAFTFLIEKSGIEIGNMYFFLQDKIWDYKSCIEAFFEEELKVQRVQVENYKHNPHDFLYLKIMCL